MQPLSFTASSEPTLGVEIELALVDSESMALKSSAQEILGQVPKAYADHIKPELMQCYIEANTSVCRTVDEAAADMRSKIQAIESIADPLGTKLLWSATHPFSSWRDQNVTPNERYEGLINLLQNSARQLVTFGLHVHVGIENGDKALMVCDRMLRHLPVLLALSCNSPFWNGRDTGLHSWRSRVMDGLPTAGLPPLLRNWSEYVWLVNHLIETGYIETIRELWWDMRPHHNFGTVEVRICDVPGSLEDSMAIAALIQCLVKALGDEIDNGTYQRDCHPFMIRQNKWQAARHGLDAMLVNSEDYQLQPAREVVLHLVDMLRGISQDLKCESHLDRAAAMARETNWSARQVELYSEHKDPAAIVRGFVTG